MTRRVLPAACLVLALGACSGAKAPLRSGPLTGGSSKAPAAAPAAPSATAAPPAKRPPAKLFAGSQSVDGTLTRYCTDNGACSDLGTPSPHGLAAPGGAPLVFALSARPETARLEVRGGRGVVATHTLTPSSTMYWQASVAKGWYVLELSATYPQTDVAWTFTLSVTG